MPLHSKLTNGRVVGNLSGVGACAGGEFVAVSCLSAKTDCTKHGCWIMANALRTQRGGRLSALLHAAIADTASARGAGDSAARFHHLLSLRKQPSKRAKSLSGTTAKKIIK